MFLCESRSTKYIVAAGLAQVSEFSFVLGSRARRFHLISREVSLFSSLDNFWGDVILSVRYCDWDNKFYEPSSFFFQVYLIILSVTTISLLLAPLLWRISLWKFGSRKLWMSSGSERTSKRAARTVWCHGSIYTKLLKFEHDRKGRENPRSKCVCNATCPRLQARLQLPYFRRFQ